MVELGFAPVFVSQGNNQEDRQMDEGLKWSWIRREWHSSGRCCHQSHLFHARTLDKHQEWDAALANFQLCCFTISWSRWGFGRRENSLRKGVATIRKVEIKHEPPSPFCPTDISTATSHTVITSMFQPSLHGGAKPLSEISAACMQTCRFPRHVGVRWMHLPRPLTYCLGSPPLPLFLWHVFHFLQVVSQ